MPFQLVVVQGGRSATPAVKLGAGATTVGRQEDCQFRIASSMVSRKHCQIFEQEGQLFVKDLGSSNGTVVNGKKVVDQLALSAGDRLTIGPVTFRVELLGAGAPATGAKAGDSGVPVALAIDDDEVIAMEIEPELATDHPDATPAAPAYAATAAHMPAGAANHVAAPAAIPIDEISPDAVEVGEDAVVDFLLNIELDEEDKP
jgi:predicted component of type VI protein secretion system